MGRFGCLRFIDHFLIEVFHSLLKAALWEACAL